MPLTLKPVMMTTDRRTRRRPDAEPLCPMRPDPPLPAAAAGQLMTDPYSLLLRRLTDRQFRRVVAGLRRTPSRLPAEERFLEAARRVYPDLTDRYLVPGPCRRRPSSADAWWWNTLPCARQQFVATLDVIRRILRVDEVCFPGARSSQPPTAVHRSPALRPTDPSPTPEEKCA